MSYQFITTHISILICHRPVASLTCSLLDEIHNGNLVHLMLITKYDVFSHKKHILTLWNVIFGSLCDDCGLLVHGFLVTELSGSMLPLTRPFSNFNGGSSIDAMRMLGRLYTQKRVFRARAMTESETLVYLQN
jgi:hypothetical protein